MYAFFTINLTGSTENLKNFKLKFAETSLHKYLCKKELLVHFVLQG